MERVATGGVLGIRTMGRSIKGSRVAGVAVMIEDLVLIEAHKKFSVFNFSFSLNFQVFNFEIDSLKIDWKLRTGN
jgi:hypothetical protein